MLFEIAVAAVAGTVTAIVVFWMLTVVLRQRLRQMPVKWEDFIRFAHESKAPIPNVVKTPPMRRQLILSSMKPALLTSMLEMRADTVDLRVVGKPTRRRIYGFFHPNANAGGGGERVLWAAIKTTLAEGANIAAIYVGVEDNLTPKVLLEKAAERFNIQFSAQEVDRIVVIFLTQKQLIEPSLYPIFNLVGQAFGQALLGYEAISNLIPDVFVDTTGLPFSYPVVRWFAQVPVVAYVHYPFIQSEMIGTLRFFSPKQIYWRGLMFAYKVAGLFANKVMANSTWTKQHLVETWSKKDIDIVYPPVAVQDFPEITGKEERVAVLAYVAQFRPEKRHELVLKAFARVVASNKKFQGKKPHLILLGSVRNLEDQQRVAYLKQLGTSLQLTDSDYTIVENAPWVAVKRILQTSLIGLNAMWNEHFGMGVVEVMAAGLIPIAHASAGPLLDIIKDDEGAPGFFFKSKSDPDYKPGDYPILSDAIITALSLPVEEQQALSLRAYKASQRFSDKVFTESWEEASVNIPKVEEKYRKMRVKSGLFD